MLVAVITWTYDPYGNVAGSSGTVPEPFTFAGQYFDSESALIYLRARYYDPFSGQFVSRDPVGGITRQPYAYVANSPLNGAGPSGYFSIGISVPIGGALGLGLAGLGTAVLWGALPAIAVVAALWPADAGGAAADDPNVYFAQHGRTFAPAPRDCQGSRPDTWNNGFKWKAKSDDTSVAPNGMSWRWHKDDTTHNEHWDCIDKNGNKTRRDNSGRVLSDDEVFKSPGGADDGA